MPSWSSPSQSKYHFVSIAGFSGKSRGESRDVVNNVFNLVPNVFILQREIKLRMVDGMWRIWKQEFKVLRWCIARLMPLIEALSKRVRIAEDRCLQCRFLRYPPGGLKQWLKRRMLMPKKKRMSLSMMTRCSLFRTVKMLVRSHRTIERTIDG